MRSFQIVPAPTRVSQKQHDPVDQNRDTSGNYFEQR